VLAVSNDLALAVLTGSDIFYPSPFLLEISGAGAKAPGALSTLSMTGIGVGVLILLCLMAILTIRFCGRGGMVVARVSRPTLEYSNRESHDYSNDQVLGFRARVSKSVGKSMWNSSESESDGLSI
jgi:hypothetical protein